MIFRCLFILLFVFGVFSPVCLAQPRISSGLIVFPVVSPKISSLFGNRVHPVRGHQLHHGGIDLAAPEKSHVRVVLDGRVVFAGKYAGYGKLVTIEHTSGRTTLYGHLSEISVNVGKIVSAGDVIGRVGSTGISTGPHLHFEWRENGQVVNPLEVFPNLKVAPRG
jgi:murein DD-endopeptidase MepM/ murein hydrolase activator NlpD